MSGNEGYDREEVESALEETCVSDWSANEAGREFWWSDGHGNEVRAYWETKADRHVELQFFCDGALVATDSEYIRPDVDVDRFTLQPIVQDFFDSLVFSK